MSRASRPARQTPFVAALLGGLLAVVAGPAAGPVAGQAADASADASAAPNTYLGPDVCRQCHFDRFESYEDSAHSMSEDPRTPAGKEACETCHGPGGRHVAGGGGRGVGGMRPFNATMTPDEKSAVCRTCHSRGIVALWPGSQHQSRDLACTDCHSIHSGHTTLLAEPSQPLLCTKCHRQIRSELLRPSHHPIREGKIVCTDCHNPHGTATDRLISATTINDKCYECHPEKRGPFLWEHPPVRENCLNCHQPHGSSHEPLLRVKRPLLCQRCHNTLGHPSVPWTLSEDEAEQGLTPFELRRRGQAAAMLFARSCTNCHVNIHGTNHPSGKFWHR